MFLKIRDNEEKQWWYVSNVDRLIVEDAEYLEVRSESGQAYKDAVAALIDEVNPDLVIMDPLFLRGRFQLITCITDTGAGTPPKEYCVLFNTEAYFCTDQGVTSHRFILNRHDHHSSDSDYTTVDASTSSSRKLAS